MGQYDRHVFVCTSGETCPTQGDTEKYVKILRAGAQKAGRSDIRINKSGCFSQCGHGPMIVVYPENVWYSGVRESDLDEILASHIIVGQPVTRLLYQPAKRGPNKIEVDTTDATAGQPPAPEAVGQGSAWTRVCGAADVPVNGMKEFTVDGVTVLIVNTGDGFAAYQALCPHEAVPLETGVHDGSILTCLEHMWQFDLHTGAPLGDAEVGLKGYRLKEERGDLYITS
ncbi:MAG TPA: Rieske 2Fe-2S domain-containing protein [Methylomirabilota bacterium]|nr:Rieske 2Fe-2S domain-containing protein [Methylomirabilota bacterium]